MRFLRSIVQFTGMGLALATFAAPPAHAESANSPGTAPSPPPVYIAGRKLHAPAFVDGGHVFVPVRGVFEAIDASVEYTPPRFIIVRKDDAVIAAFILDRRRAIVGREAVDLDVAPMRRDGRIFVPLRVVAESAGAAVTYSNAPPSIDIVPAGSSVSAPSPAGGSANSGASYARFGRAGSTLQWRIGVAVFTALCCLGCLVLTARRLAPTLFGPAPRRSPAPPKERPLPPQPPSDRVDLSSVEATGEALIHKRIVTETHTVHVPLAREELVIEYGGDGGTVIVEGRELGAGETVRIALWEERVHIDVTKHILVTQDVVVDKRRITVPAPPPRHAPAGEAEAEAEPAPAASIDAAPDFAIAEGSPS